MENRKAVRDTIPRDLAFTGAAGPLEVTPPPQVEVSHPQFRHAEKKRPPQMCSVVASMRNRMSRFKGQ